MPTMLKLSKNLLSLARHLVYNTEKELCNCCVILLSNCFMEGPMCSTQLRSEFVLTPGVDGSNVHWDTIPFGMNGQESIKFMGLHKYIRAAPWSLPVKTLLLDWRHSAFNRGKFRARAFAPTIFCPVNCLQILNC